MKKREIAFLIFCLICFTCAVLVGVGLAKPGPVEQVAYPPPWGYPMDTDFLPLVLGGPTPRPTPTLAPTMEPNG